MQNKHKMTLGQFICGAGIAGFVTLVFGQRNALSFPELNALFQDPVYNFYIATFFF